MNHTMANLNPFTRSQLKIAAPLSLVSTSYVGWSQSYELEYRASRGAADAGLLAKQFKVGTPLVVGGKHVVVRSASLTLTNGTIDEVTIRVEAVDFAAVLAQATGQSPAHLAPAARKPGHAAPVVPFTFGGTKRRILQ